MHDKQPAAHADLWCCQTNATLVVHELEHVFGEILAAGRTFECPRLGWFFQHAVSEPQSIR
jgi:hypothetical protein